MLDNLRFARGSGDFGRTARGISDPFVSAKNFGGSNVPKVKAALTAILALAILMALAPVVSADTVTGQGTASGNRYRGGVRSAGGVTYVAGIQVNRDPTGAITKVRAVGKITKLSKAAVVQVDSLRLATSTTTVLTKTTPVNSGTRATALSTIAWRGVAPRTCTQYRARVNYSVRWTDRVVSKFSILSPLTNVCGPTAPKVYRNCAALNLVFHHGVGRPGAVDHTRGVRVTNFYVSAYIYSANTARDADHDGIACEKR